MQTQHSHRRDAGRQSIPRLPGFMLATGLVLVVALCQPQQAWALDASPVQADVARVFDIAPGPLGRALTRFGSQAGVKVLVPSALVRGLTSPGVRGTMPPAEALQQLLAGAGLVWRSTAPGAITLERAPDSVGGTQVLEQVTVTDRADRDLADAALEAAGSLHHISREQLDKVPVTSARDVFAETPGVWVMDGRQNPGININIRGMQGPGRNNVMIDGTRQNFGRYGGYNGLGSQIYIDPELIADVSIEKGPTSGAHGVGAIGGVVNLRTLEAADLLKDGQRHAVQLRGSTGTDNYHGSGSVAGAWRASDRVSLIVATSARHNGDYESGERDSKGRTMAPTSLVPNPPVPGGEVAHTHQKSRSALLKTDIALAPAHNLKLGATWHENEYSYDRMGFSGTWGTPTEGRAYALTAKYAWTPAAQRWLDLRANLWMSDSKDQDDYGSSGSAQRKLRTTGGEVYNTSRIRLDGGGLNLTYGGEFFRDDADQTQGLDVGGRRDVGSAFLQSRWMPLPWLHADAGLRYDYFTLKGSGQSIAPLPGQNPFPFVMDRGDSRINPSLALSVMPLPGAQFYVRYAEGLRPPVLSETMMSGQAFMTPIAPNLDLKAEVSRNREYGFSLLRDGLLAGDDKLRLKVAYFDNRYEDWIRRDYTRFGAVGVLSFENLDRARFQGWEWQAGYDLGYAYASIGHTRFSKMRFCDDGSCERQVGGLGDWSAPNIPPTRKVTADAGVRLLQRRLELGARARHDSDIANVSTQEDNTWRWQGYRLYDLYGSYRPLPDLKLAFSVENVGDRYYVDALSGGRMPGPGRNAKLSFSYQF